MHSPVYIYIMQCSYRSQICERRNLCDQSELYLIYFLYIHTHTHTHTTYACTHTYTHSRSEARGDHVVYLEIVISTCLTHKPVPYRNSFISHIPIVVPPVYRHPFSLGPSLLRSALNAQSIFPCTPLREDRYILERPFVNWNPTRALAL